MAALLVVAIDQSWGTGHGNSARIAAAAVVGATLGLGISKLIAIARRPN